MPLFTTLGLAVGAGAGAAFAVGVGVTAIAAGVGVAAFAAGGGFDSQGAGDGDSRIAGSTATGALTAAESEDAAKKRAFRSGVLFTSPGGVGSSPRTSSAKLR